MSSRWGSVAGRRLVFAAPLAAAAVALLAPGTAAAPTAPPGRVCLYLSASVGMSTTVTGEAIPLLAGSRSGFVVQAVQTDAATGVFGAWAYTAQ